MRVALTMVPNLSHVVRDPLLWVVLYFGPDLLMPLTSALAAMAGVLLMFWRRALALVQVAWSTIFRRPKNPRA